MKDIRVGINGFGRIGKLVYQELVRRKAKVLIINDPFFTAEHILHSLKYDTTFGRSCMEARLCGDKVCVCNIESKILKEKKPEEIDWEGADIVVEASGAFTTIEGCRGHLRTAKRVIITAPSSDAPTYVYGVNHTSYKGEEIVSNASCTTNCLAPISKILYDSFGIEEGLMTTIHAVTSTQKVVDSCTAKRTGRSCFNIIPSSTGAAKALAKVLPGLEGKMTGMAFRVPVLNVSVVDLTVKLKKETTLDEIRDRVKEAASSVMKGVICYTEDEVVSQDYNRCSLSCVFDTKASIALSKTFFKIVCWYDNEHGYSCRIADMVEHVLCK